MKSTKKGKYVDKFFLLLQKSIVAYDETQKPTLKKALVLDDALSDLPQVCIL
jgi:hypothetical protein